MRTRIFTIALSSVISLGIAAAAPQQDQQAPAAGEHRGMRQMMDPDQQVKHMAKRLNLTSEQQDQIRPILADAQTQAQAARADTSLSREDKMAKMKSIHEDTETKLKAVLNDDQKAQYDKMMAERRSRMQERMHGQNGATPDSSKQ